MPKMSAAYAAAMRWVCALTTGALVMSATAAQAEWDRPWKDSERALVIDAYEFNPINWKELTADKRIAAFINKASDGMPPEWSCRGLSGTDENLCKNRWWKYTVTQELYLTRREMAKTLGLKWGAYHLGRPGNPREQADHFVDFAQPEDDDLIALDIEDNDPDEWMSLADAETFARQIKIRIGRYPVLYTNGSTAAYIAQHKETYPLLSRLQLWYARYREDLTGVFPEGNWPTYALWQFSSMHNCNKRSCPYRVAGAKNDIDVNVSPLNVADLRTAWPFNGLVGGEPDMQPDAGQLIAEVGKDAKDAVAKIGTEVAELVSPAEANAGEVAEVEKPVADTLAAAYGPATHAPIDPLKLLTEAARREHSVSTTAPVLSALTQGPKTDPLPLGDRPSIGAADGKPSPLIDAVSQLKDEMRAVREILRDKPAVEASAEVDRPRAALPADLKSRIARMMQEAEAAVKSVPIKSHSGKSPDERADAGFGRTSWTTLAHLTPTERRIAKAFSATR